MPLTYSGFFLGTGPSIDPTEGNTSAENASALVGQTYGGVQDALVNDIVTITSVNLGGSATALDQNNTASNDQFVVNDGNGPVTYVFDAAAQYNITITYTDGSTATVTGVVFQSTTGELFLAPGITPGGAYNTALEAGAIRSVTVNSVVGSNFAGLASDRAVLNYPTCFAEGTRIATPAGTRPVERLAPGDLVLTVDHGPQPLAWIGRRWHAAETVARMASLRPVRVAAGALGAGLPHRDLLLSRQHRLLVTGRIAARLAGCSEVMVAAGHLVGLPGIALGPVAAVSYWHLLFHRHEVVLAEGAPAESLLLAPMSLGALGALARAEIALMAPGCQAREPARPCLTGARMRALRDRHSRHGRPLLDGWTPGLRLLQSA